MMTNLPDHSHAKVGMWTRIAHASILAGIVFSGAVLARLAHPGIEASFFWALLDVTGVLFAGFAILAGFNFTSHLLWVVLLIPGYVCLVLLLLAVAPPTGPRPPRIRSCLKILGFGLILSSVYLVAAEAAGVTSYLATGVSQFVDSLYSGPRPQKIGTILVSLVVLRFLVAITVGQLVSVLVAWDKSAWTVISVGVFVPLVIELALHRMLIPDWFSMGLVGLRVVASYMSIPLVGGLVAAFVGLRHNAGP